MKNTRYVQSFRELEVYQRSFEMARAIFEASKLFPREETYSLTDQVRRASRSIGAQIAEAWGKRRYEKHFISKLSDADAEQLETQHWIKVAVSCGYLDHKVSTDLIIELERIGRMLNSMIKKANLFCGSHESELKEAVLDYGEDFTDHR